MTDRPDPINTPEQRERVLHWLTNPARYWEERCARAEAALAADSAAGIVRVDTCDEALHDRLWGVVEDVLEATGYRPAPSEVVEAVLTALRDES